jgi:hypothetical protein
MVDPWAKSGLRRRSPSLAKMAVIPLMMRANEKKISQTLTLKRAREVFMVR